MFNTEDTLVIPISVEALAVNENFRLRNSRRWQMNFFQLLRHNNPEPLPFHGEIEDAYFDKPQNWGVYLHWMVPSALRIIEHDKDGRPECRPLPNRWLVVRIAGNNDFKSWFIESDSLNDQYDGGSTFAYIDRQKKIQISKLGKSYEIKSFKDARVFENKTATFRTEQFQSPKSLSAVGFGDINFLAYQPLVNDVFSFHDNLSDFREGEKVNVPPQLHYAIFGWYSDDNEEILSCNDNQTIVDVLLEFKWLIEYNKDETKDEYLSRLNKLKKSLFYGKIHQIEWREAMHVQDRYDSDKGDLKEARLKIAIGNSPSEALISLLNLSKIDTDVIQFLKAFQYGQLELLKEPGGNILLEQEARKSWFKAKTHGKFWLITKNENLAAGEKLIEPDLEAFELLEILNKNQEIKEKYELELQELQQFLYDAWWQLNVRKENTLGDEESQKSYTDDIENLKNSKLAESIRGKLKMIDEEDILIRNTLARIEGILNTGATVKDNKENDKKPSYVLSEKIKSTFWKTNDPVILITGITAPRPFITNDTLTCYPPEKTPERDKKVIFTGNTVLDRLLADFSATSDIEEYKWMQPWNPVFMEWETEWFTLPYCESENKSCWKWRGSDYELELTTEEIENTENATSTGFIMSGRVFLTPQSNQLLKQQFEQLKSYMPKEKQEKLTNLENFINELVMHKFLSQGLMGFNNQLLMRNMQLSLLPNDIEFKELIGDQSQSQPVTPATLPYVYDGIRQGQFKLNKLQVYDGYGQCMVLVGEQGTIKEKNFTPIAEKQLIPNPGTTVSNKNPNRFIELKPRLADYAQLRFDFVDSDDDNKIINIHKDVNPICGWIIHNHLDKSLIYFNNQGKYTGETRIVQEQVLHSIPGIINNKVFSAFVADIPSDNSSFANFINVIDESLWTINSNASTQDIHQAVWIGNPLALVRVRLKFEIFGSQQTNDFRSDLLNKTSLPDHQNPVYLGRKNKKVLDMKFAIKLGSQGIRQDGLIGYFNDNIFHAVHAQTQYQSDFLKVIKDKNLLTTNFSQEIYLNLLIDPYTNVYAQTGIFPYTSIRLPDNFIKEALDKIEIHFRYHSLLTTIEQRVGQEKLNSITLPLPSLQKGNWQWDEKEETFDIKAPSISKVLPLSPVVIRDGRLSLSDVFLKEKTKE
jgi:hypothetical protein